MVGNEVGGNLGAAVEGGVSLGVVEEKKFAILLVLPGPEDEAGGTFPENVRRKSGCPERIELAALMALVVVTLGPLVEPMVLCRLRRMDIMGRVGSTLPAEARC